jgi:hypothetical protein
MDRVREVESVQPSWSHGAAREGSIASFLETHLPERFAVTTGEAVDSQDRRSTQLDVIVYDRNLSAPLLRATDKGDLVPAEALLAVIEAKSKLTKAQAENCCSAVASLARLRPYGKPFIAPREGGQHAEGRVRCQYSVLAFDTDLGTRKWADSEWARIQAAATSEEAPLERIDRIAVLTRGLLLPPDCEAIVIADAPGVLRDWFLHLTNFLVRESSRRAPYDWSAYLRDRPGSRIELEGYAGPRRSRAVHKSRQSQAPTGKAAARRTTATRRGRSTKSKSSAGTGRPRKT